MELSKRYKESKVITKTTKIVNENGIHMRPCMEIVDVSEKFDSDINISKDGIEWLNAKSMMHICSIGIKAGSDLMIRAEGHDEATAVDAIMELVEKGFGEKIVENRDEHKNL